MTETLALFPVDSLYVAPAATVLVDDEPDADLYAPIPGQLDLFTGEAAQ